MQEACAECSCIADLLRHKLCVSTKAASLLRPATAWYAQYYLSTWGLPLMININDGMIFFYP